MLASRISPLLVATALAARVSAALVGGVRGVAVQPRAALLASAALFQPPPISPDELKKGNIVIARVLRPHAAGGYEVEIGAPKPACLPRGEVALLPNVTSGRVPGQGWVELNEGEVYQALVIGVGGGEVNVSLARAQRAIAWQRIEQLFQEDISYNATVLSINEAGANVDIEMVAGFVPWSHWHLNEEAWANRYNLIGSRLMVKFLEMDPARKRLVVSHRRYLLQKRLKELSPGQLVSGHVCKIMPYGVIVRLADGLDGLLHISQVSKTFVKDMTGIFEMGEALTCVVLKVDITDGSISLSTKMLEKEQGEMLSDRAAVMARTNVAEAVTELSE